jgi:hypothetical protein
MAPEQSDFSNFSLSLFKGETIISLRPNIPVIAAVGLHAGGKKKYKIYKFQLVI